MSLRSLAALVPSFGLALCLGLALMTACSSVRTGGLERLSPDTTWAWTDSTPLELYDPDGRPLPWLQFREEIAAQLEAHGLAEAAAGEDPDLRLRAGLTLALRTRQNDPYFAAFVAERFEEIDLLVELLDPATFEAVWFGEATHRLRFLERSPGGLTVQRWVAVDEERDWSIEAVVGRILNALPYLAEGVETQVSEEG